MSGMGRDLWCGWMHDLKRCVCFLYGCGSVSRFVNVDGCDWGLLMWIYTCPCVDVCMCVCICACVYMWIYVHMCICVLSPQYYHNSNHFYISDLHSRCIKCVPLIISKKGKTLCIIGWVPDRP